MRRGGPQGWPGMAAGVAFGQQGLLRKHGWLRQHGGDGRGCCARGGMRGIRSEGLRPRGGLRPLGVLRTLGGLHPRGGLRPGMAAGVAYRPAGIAAQAWVAFSQHGDLN